MHISLQSLNCELYLSKPLKKKRWAVRGMWRGREKKGISTKQKSSKKLIQLCWKLFPAHSTFFTVYRHTRSQQGAFFPAKIRTISKSDHHQREIQQPSGCKAKQSEIILGLCKTKSYLWELTVVAASHKHCPGPSTLLGKASVLFALLTRVVYIR